MKINKKKILESTTDNRNLILGVFVVIFIFSMCLLPLIKKGTFSNEEIGDSIIITCPETALVGASVDCSIVLNAVTMNVSGVVANYSIKDGLEYESFNAFDDWDNYETVNVVESDGFLLISDGVIGESSVGTVRFKVLDDAVVDDIYKVELTNIIIGDGVDSEVSLENVFDEIKIVSDNNNDNENTVPNGEEEKSDINTLSSIKVNDGEIALSPSFSLDIYEYTATTDSETVIIKVTKTDEKSMVSEDVSGEKSLNVGLNNFVITVTSESGNVKEYTLKITRVEKVEDDNYSLSFDDSLNVDLEKKYIKNLSAGTTGTDLTNKVTVVSGNVKLYDVSGNEKDSDKSLASGDVLRIYSNNVLKEEYTISVVGDSNGDGVVDLIDLVQLRKHVAGWIDPKTGEVYSKTNVYYYSLDLNKDGVVDLIDVVRMRKINAGVI